MSEEQRVVKAYAGFAPNTELKPWTYVAHPLGEEEVEIEISHCGICGSDLHTLNSGWGPTMYPVVVGHEIVGKVIAKGPKVSHLDIGQRVGVGAQACACLKETCVDCRNGDNNCCPKGIFTYNAKYPDGHIAYGGYASHIRLSAHFAFKIPESIPSDVAAPLLCAGVTVATPLFRHGAAPGVKVGILGIGGLGHLALQFANKLGADVTAVSSSDKKKEEAFKLGAHHYINSSNKAELDAAARSLDILLVTSFAQADWSMYLNFLRTGGKLIMVGVPESALVIPPFALIARRLQVIGSIIGSTSEIQRTLDFAAEHKVYPVIQNYPIEKVNEAIASVENNTVRYRCVLENKF